MKKIIAVILTFCISFLVCGCNSKEELIDISYHVSSLPKTIDPQIASTSEEKCVVLNVFEGLTRINNNGTANLAAAESYTISSDGLEYVFKLDKTKVWSNGQPLTAHDFVFGMKRAVDPSTKSADTVKISIISGAAAILSGNADISTLGVEAVDDYTLKITLKASCPQFLSYLATPAFMPCNEEFFNQTNGKYGLDQKNTIYNGVYYVNGWKPEKNYISIKISKKYSGIYSPVFNTVMLQTAGADTLITDFNEEKIHLISLNSSDVSKFQNYNVLEIENTTCALYINKTFATDAMLSALKLSVNKDGIAESTGNNIASGYIPNTAVIGDQRYYTLSSIPLYDSKYDPDLAYEQFVNELSSENYKGSFPSASLLYINQNGMEEIAKKIAAGWQSDLGAFVNIKSVSEEELSAAIQADSFAFALVPISAESNNAGDYMNSLANSGLTLSSEDFFETVQSFAYSANMKEYCDRIIKAHQMAINTDNLMPICHITKKNICNSNIFDKLNYINGTFDFTTVQ